MERYQVILAYDGNPYQGFQRQGRSVGSVATVQGVIEEALRRIGWQGDSILAAGRTDTGVHASGQVIVFDLDWKHPPDALLRALNAQFPPQVSAQQVQVVPTDFHPRFDAVARSYVYHLYTQPVRDPLRERYAWRVWPLFDLDLLQQAAKKLLGKHDFAAFGTPPRVGGSTGRTIYQSAWQQAGDKLTFNVTADAFLYHMVRRIVYVQVAVAQGRIALAALDQALENPAGYVGGLISGLAPPHGLVLTQVHYQPCWYRPRKNLEEHPDQFKQEF